jgi:hypothetical protein
MEALTLADKLEFVTTRYTPKELGFTPIIVGYRKVDEMEIMPSSASFVYNLRATGKTVTVPIFRCQHDGCNVTDQQDELQCHVDNKLVAHYCSDHRVEHGFCYICGEQLDEQDKDGLCGECLYWSSDWDYI